MWHRKILPPTPCLRLPGNLVVMSQRRLCLTSLKTITLLVATRLPRRQWQPPRLQKAWPPRIWWISSLVTQARRLTQIPLGVSVRGQPLVCFVGSQSWLNFKKDLWNTAAWLGEAVAVEGPNCKSQIIWIWSGYDTIFNLTFKFSRFYDIFLG